MTSDANLTPSVDHTPRAKQRLTARALLETKRLSDPQLHPDGLRVAFVVTEADFGESHFVSHLWLTEYPVVEEEEDEEEEEENSVGALLAAPNANLAPNAGLLAAPNANLAPNAGLLAAPNANLAPNAGLLAAPNADAAPNPQPTIHNRQSSIDNPPSAVDADLTRQLTYSRDGETQPRWSPDGRYLAFLSSRPDETEAEDDEDDDLTDQVWILPGDGGESRKVTSAREGVLDYVWVPDTNSIVYLASEPRPRPLEQQRKEERNRRKVDPIVEQEDRLRRQLWRVDVDDRKPKLLLTGDYGVTDIAISPDGARLAFTTNYTGEGNDYHLADLYVRYLNVEKTVKLVARKGGKYHLRWSPDGKQLVFLSWLDPQLSYSRESLFICDAPDELPDETAEFYGQDAQGLTECRLLTDLDYDISAFEWAHAKEEETDDEAVSPPGQEANETNLPIGYALAAIRTGSEIIAIGEQAAGSRQQALENAQYPTPNTQHPTPTAERYDLHCDPGGHALAYVQETATSLPEIFLRDENGDTHQLTKLNADFADAYLLPRQEVVTWTSSDGLTIEGVLTLPQGKREEGKEKSGEETNPTPNTQPPTPEHSASSFPLIVQIHGGPKGRSSNTLQNYSMASVWAAEGYAVLRPNFRGSEGYGNAFAIANRRDLGGGDFADIVAGVDWCIAQGIADPGRLGVMGGSYGGYMTNWAIGHTDRFKAAISMFGIFHLQTDYSNSELSRWDNEYLGAYYWEDPDIYRKLSPGSYIEAIKTPTLIIHGDEDSNTFISNSKELYQALRHRGVTTQFVHYPREGHGVREPNHKLDEIRRCLAWMDKYVRNTGQHPPVYRLGDRIPNPKGDLELRITRAEIVTFVGQTGEKEGKKGRRGEGETEEGNRNSIHNPKSTIENPEHPTPSSALLEVVLTIHNVDTRQAVAPLTLVLSEVRLESGAGAEAVSQQENDASSPPLLHSPTPLLLPVGVPIDVLGGKVLVEGDNLRTTQYPDEETGQLAFGCAVVFRVPKVGGEGMLRVAEFPPVLVAWTAEEDDEPEEKPEA